MAITLYRVRDQLLTGEVGERYRTLYEQHTGRISQLLVQDAALRAGPRRRVVLATNVAESSVTVEGVRAGCAVAVSWLPDDADGEVMVLLVEARHGVAASAFPEIAERCRSAVRAATGLAADTVEVLLPGTLPRTSSGKLRRQEALRRYRRGELSPPDAVTPLRLASAILRSSLQMARMRWSNRD